MTARRRLGRLPRLRPAVVIGLVVIAALLGGGWLWLRGSSLVAVQRVSVIGASGPDATKIRTALVAAAHNMTTLEVSMSQLYTAVAPYPNVKHLDVSTSFPHGMRIRVIEQLPVAVVSGGGRQIEVASDGTLLHADSAIGSLPTIAVGVAPGGSRLTGWARSAVSLLAAAPYQLLGHIQQVTEKTNYGLTAELRNGPNIYFGTGQQLSAKWTAAAAVLADSSSAGASYVDVSDPSRPAAGTTGATGVASSADSGTAPGSTATATDQTAPTGG